MVIRSPPTTSVPSASLELVSCGRLAEFLVAGEDGGEGEEGAEVVGVALVSEVTVPERWIDLAWDSAAAMSASSSLQLVIQRVVIDRSHSTPAR